MAIKHHGFHEKLNSVKDLEPFVAEQLKQNYKGFENITMADYVKGGADTKCSMCGNYLAEIKIDFTAYDNHFVEKWSDLERKKPGGPYQYSFVKYYVYFYTVTQKLHIFEPNTLIKFIDAIPQIDKIWGKKVFQKGADYKTFGYAIPKIILNHLDLADTLLIDKKLIDTK